MIGRSNRHGVDCLVFEQTAVPDTLEVLWEYPRTLVTFSQYNANAAPADAQKAEVEIRGTKGTMYIHTNRWEVIPESTTAMATFPRTPLDRESEKAYGPSRKRAMEPRKTTGTLDTIRHARNFLDCVKSRALCNCDVETGHLSTSATLIANIAHRTRSFLEWDAKAERFTNNTAANERLQYKYRAPYKLG